MNIFQFTREIIEVESTTWNEGGAGRWLRDYLSDQGFAVETQTVSDGRFNVYAKLGEPKVTFSSHMDTVPPYFGFREDDKNIYGRGACDAKGVIAAQVFAAQKLRDEGFKDFGMLYVVGEEDGSDGAQVANNLPNQNKFLINGEPTESKQAIATKGALRLVIEAHGKIAHAAYPELGDSAIEKLMDILNEIRHADWPSDPLLGTTTYNIGTITGGRKANVVPDFAAAELMFRTVTHPDDLYKLISERVGKRAEIKRGFSIVPVHCQTVNCGHEIPTDVVRFATDIPCLTKWGKPLLYGPGSIHDAHTTHEYIAKEDLQNAVTTYADMAKTLLATE